MQETNINESKSENTEEESITQVVENINDNTSKELSVLRVDDLHKYFRKKHAVKGVSFSR